MPTKSTNLASKRDASLITVMLASAVVAACGGGGLGGPDGGGTGGHGTGGVQSGGTGGTGAGGTTGAAGAGAGGAGTGGGTGTGGATGAGGAGTGVGGSGGHATGGAGGAAPGAGGAAGHGSGGAGGNAPRPCQNDNDCLGFTCCNGFCANTANDVLNCGGCGTVCPGPSPYCTGHCATAPCNSGTTCGAGSTCCGSKCCTGGTLCCLVREGPDVLDCFAPVNGTCPMGCAACACAAPSTPIATPSGDRPIAEIKEGELVYSVKGGVLAAVPVKQVHRSAVTAAHRMVELRLAHGVTMRISPVHPTADGRRFGDLAAGDLLDGVPVQAVRLVAYGEPFTYDILPDSDSGTYFAGGVLIGSTLAEPPPPARPRPTASIAPASRARLQGKGAP
jgi:hypothetical protein